MPCCNPTTLAVFMAILTCPLLGKTSPTEGDTVQPPVVTVNPVPVFHRPGKTVQLSCSASGNPQPKYEWFRNNTPILINGSDTFAQSESGVTSTLTIDTEASESDGEYHCVAKNNFGSAFSSPASVQRAYLIINTNSTREEEVLLKQHSAKEGVAHVLDCGAPGSVLSVPAHVSRWYVPRARCEEVKDCRWRPLKRTEENIVIGPDGSLWFSYLLPKDSMMYRCDAYNKELRESKTVAFHKLTVTKAADGESTRFEPTRMFDPVSPVIGKAGENVTLRCYFSGRPLPVIEWTKVGQPHHKLGEGREINITNLQTSDEGSYRCQVKGLKVRHDVDVRVSPYIEQGPESVVVQVDENAQFKCQPRGSGSLSISWYYNDILLSERSNLSVAVNISSDSHTLTLHKVQVNQTASISCTVSSEDYGTARKSGFLFVKEKPVQVTEVETTSTATTTTTTTKTTSTLDTTTKATPSSTSYVKYNSTKRVNSDPFKADTPKGPDVAPTEATDDGTAASLDNPMGKTIGIVVICILLVIFSLIIVVCVIVKISRWKRKQKKKQPESKKPQGEDGLEMQQQHVHIIAENRHSYQDEDYHSDDSGLGVDDRLAVNNI